MDLSGANAKRVIRTLERTVSWRGKPAGSMDVPPVPNTSIKSSRSGAKGPRAIELLYIQRPKQANPKCLWQSFRTARSGHEYLNMHFVCNSQPVSGASDPKAHA